MKNNLSTVKTGPNSYWKFGLNYIATHIPKFGNSPGQVRLCECDKLTNTLI